MPDAAPPNKRVIGAVLLISAVLMLVGAILVGLNVLPLAPDLRMIVIIALCGAAFVDAVIAVKFFLTSSTQ